MTSGDNLLEKLLYKPLGPGIHAIDLEEELVQLTVLDIGRSFRIQTQKTIDGHFEDVGQSCEHWDGWVMKASLVVANDGSLNVQSPGEFRLRPTPTQTKLSKTFTETICTRFLRRSACHCFECT
jgi:hypothetical protein